MAKNSSDQWSGFFWVAVSLFVSVESIHSGVGSFHNPGAGFLPFCSAVVLGMSGVAISVTNILKKKGQRRITDLWKEVEWKKVVWVMSALFLYSFLLSGIGYLIATFGLLIFLFGIMRRRKMWIREIASALFISLVTYLLFHVLMDIQLPRGIFGL